ncbi:MAG: signal peptide peptidase SppA [Desulfosalsimonadaceae bacterium]
MFTRRHPFLFFVLVFTAIVASAVVLTSLISAVTQEKGDLGFGEKVGVVEIEGMITDAREVLDRIRAFREADSVKAIVLRINSPGGAVGPAQEIYREVEKTVKQKRVVASLGPVAASGGYYVAASADRIMASPGTVTGSIGVIMAYTNFRELFEKIGLRPVVIKSGKYKDMGSPLREISDEERALLQKFTDTVHEQFITDVAEGRGKKPEAVREIADGRIFSGAAARELGLIDRLGNQRDAVVWAGRLAGIKGRVRAVYPPEEKPSLLEYAMDMIESRFKAMLQDFTSVPGAYLYAPGR